MPCPVSGQAKDDTPPSLVDLGYRAVSRQDGVMKPTRKLLSEPPARQIFKPEQIDDVAEAVIALTRELWVTVDRVAVLEKVLENRGVPVQAEIDAYQPDEAFQAELDAKRDRLLNAVLVALKAVSPDGEPKP